MALCSLEDVKRVLRLTNADEVRDAQLRASLTAVEAWIRPSLGAIIEEGPQVQVYFDIFEDATLYLPTDDCTVVRVRVFLSPPTVEDARPQATEMRLGQNYDIDTEGRLMLRPSFWIAPFEGALAVRMPRQYHKVEVFYLSTGVISPAITEGIALLAAGYFHEGPALLAGISREKIGDYEYWTTTGTSASEHTTAYIQRALMFLNRGKPRARVQVT